MINESVKGSMVNTQERDSRKDDECGALSWDLLLEHSNEEAEVIGSEYTDRLSACMLHS